MHGTLRTHGSCRTSLASAYATSSLLACSCLLSRSRPCSLDFSSSATFSWSSSRPRFSVVPLLWLKLRREGQATLCRVRRSAQGWSQMAKKRGACILHLTLRNATTPQRHAPEAMPFLLELPHFNWTGGYALLGLGDILIPGLLLAFAARVDYSSVRGSIWPSHSHGIGYYSILSIGYTVGTSLKRPLTYT